MYMIKLICHQNSIFLGGKMVFLRCNFEEIEQYVSDYYVTNQIVVDSFWEDHILKSQHYKIMHEDKIIGFFAIFEENMISLFHLLEDYAHYGQVIFERVKRYEQVTNAFVPTGDEFFLSHAIDNFTRLEKQAYFSVYRSEPLKKELVKNIKLRKLNGEADAKLLEIAGDFFDKDSCNKVIAPNGNFEIYIVEENEEIVGFGVIEYSQIIKKLASIGMFVCEKKRELGYARNILKALQIIVEENDRKAVSGCWYFNHNSKKSMESAGAFSKTRLLRFYF